MATSENGRPRLPLRVPQSPDLQPVTSQGGTVLCLADLGSMPHPGQHFTPHTSAPTASDITTVVPGMETTVPEKQ